MKTIMQNYVAFHPGKMKYHEEEEEMHRQHITQLDKQQFLKNKD